MDIRFDEKTERFRQDIRIWLEANVPTAPMPADPEAAFGVMRDWQGKMYDAGWAGIHWPQAYGGRGATLLEQAVLHQELARVKAPPMANGLGLLIVGPTLMDHGTEAQKKRYIPKILSAEEIWCQGFSEPNSGSDLASLQTRAVEDGDDFVVNGQKIWTSYAQYSQMCILLVRTDPEAPKHRGISYLLVDMQSPGVTVKPLRQMSGGSEFNEVFFDNVRVPKTHLVGELNTGWRIAMTTLTHERGSASFGTQVHIKRSLDDIIDLAKKVTRNGRPLSEDPVMRQKLAAAYIRIDLMRLNNYRTMTRQLRGESPGPAASLDKLYWSEAHQWLQEVGQEILGLHSQLSPVSPYYPTEVDLHFAFLFSRAETIFSGTSEIQKNIIGERVLGLPRG
ncbi:MAG: acyl-CoA dehydrogenase [bacterium]|nr:acyl-CoA dehydrogenase [bacterium]